jgi:HPt (histidine-containing phosphotransfer) domain-containing protein
MHLRDSKTLRQISTWHSDRTSLEPFDYALLNELKTFCEPGESNRLCDLTDTFLKEAAAQINGIRECLERERFLDLSKIAHSLKGSSSNLGARRLACLCKEIEEYSSTGDLNAATLKYLMIKKEFSVVEKTIYSAISQNCESGQ